MSKANIPFDMKISFPLWEGGKELRIFFNFFRSRLPYSAFKTFINHISWLLNICIHSDLCFEKVLDSTKQSNK